MPEGPSLVIAVEELADFVGKEIVSSTGNTTQPKERLVGEVIRDIFSYGKYLNFQFDEFALRIHFMLWGSYRVNEERENRKPRLTLTLEDGNVVNFYACSVKLFDNPDIRSDYDFRTDIMSPLWNKRYVMKLARQSSNETVDDLLMDQQLFTGVGNIIKNEVLWRQHLLPDHKVADLSPRKLSALVQEARDYSQQFYEWKKQYVLRKNYRIYRQGTCPLCKGKVTRRKTGKRERLSHWCTACQK
jgi:endonuclease-8